MECRHLVVIDMKRSIQIRKIEFEELVHGDELELSLASMVDKRKIIEKDLPNIGRVLGAL